MNLQGAYSAIITPFRNGKVDFEAFKSFVNWQIEEGIDGLVPCGTTGESATLSHEEHEQVILTCIEIAKKRVKVIAGAGSNNTSEAIRLTKFAKEAGADVALHITPYYNKPTQEGIFRHFAAIAEKVDMPIFVYNVPGRTASNVTPQTMARLAREIPNIIGVKEATANLQQISDIIELCPENFCLLSGDDFTLLPALAIGAKGVISVASNVTPSKMSGLCKAFFAGDLAEAKRLHYQMQDLCRNLFIETNPIPVKLMLAEMNKLRLEYRLPLCEPSEANANKIKKSLEDFLAQK